MKILWMCNIMLPKIAEHLSLPKIHIGGWLTGLSNDLLKESDISLSVCFPKRGSFVEGQVENMTFYSFTAKNTEERLKDILLREQPDIIHIFGTETGNTLNMVECCEKLGWLDRVVINIQGLVSIYALHYTNGLPYKVIKRCSLRKIFSKRKDSIEYDQQVFQRHGKKEILALQKVKHVIGRTDWDRACCLQYNPNVQYHFCNETLRDRFYQDSKWSLEHCERYSIFLSQCSYPVKGFHFMLEAMPEILKLFPQAHIYTTGPNLLDPVDKITSYQKYLADLIRELHLEKNVTFMGMLSEEEMKEQYLKSHVFVSASTCENSPNSVGEAMILGTPVVTSDVGGVKNLLTHNQEGFIYQVDAPYMLAYYVKELFQHSERCQEFSQTAQIHAQQTHDKRVNLQTMLAIYQSLLQK